MNKEELKAFVEEDKEIINQEIVERVSNTFFDILGVYPDLIFPEIIYEKTYDYSLASFRGYCCTLDGAEFFVGDYFSWYRCFPIIYQAISMNVKPKAKIEYIKIDRPADIVVE